MNNMNQREEFAKFIKLITDDLEEKKKDKIKLVEIMLEKIDAKFKLNKLKEVLLEIQVRPLNTHDNEVSNEVTLGELMRRAITIDIDIYIADILTKLLEPAKEHQCMLENIGKIIKCEKLEEEEKINKISNLLI